MDKEKKRKQRNEESIFKAIFNEAVDGIITIDKDACVTRINPAASRLFGYNQKEVIGNNIKMLMPEPFHSKHDEYVHNHNTTGVKKIIGTGRQVKGRRKDGTIFPFHLSVSKIQLEGKYIYAGFIHDISDLKHKESELELSKNRLDAIFDNAVDGIIIINKQGLIQMVNRATINLFGFDEEEILGQNIKVLMPEPYHGEHDGYLHNYQATRKRKIIGIGREVKGQRKDGSVFSFKLSVSEVKLNEQEVIYTGIIHDLTEQKKREDEIKKLNGNLEVKIAKRTEDLSQTVTKLLDLNKKLEFEIKERHKVELELQNSKEELKSALESEMQLSELKSRFISMASHEFRTPLSTIRSSAALIGKYTETLQQDKREKHINRITKSVIDLTGILNDFLSLSKLEEGKVDVKPELFNWEELCIEIEDGLVGVFKPGQKIIHDNTIKNEINLDSRLLKNILFNLLSNASKYSGENTSIYCTSKIVDNSMIISIKDEGIGIPEKDQQHLFTRFFRAANAANIQGTGLGLTIVKRYVELLEGTIDYVSIENQGTTFTIAIPLKK